MGVGEPVRVVVWDSIGNTLLGVRPWASWDPPYRDALLAENPDGERAAPPLGELLAGHDLRLTWLNSADQPYEAFGQLYADYADALRFTRDPAEIAAAVRAADVLILRLAGYFHRRSHIPWPWVRRE